MNYSFEYIDIILLAMIAGFIILRLRDILGKRTGFEGKIVFDPYKLDGTPRKLLDSSKIIKLGWKKTINLYEGIEFTYKNYLK